jgi:hypothetical protein
MLKVTYHKKSQGTLERQVRIKVDMLVMLWDAIEDFQRVYKHALTGITQLNHISPEFAFRLKILNPTECELWHFDINGVPDRKIATVKEL